MNLGILGDLLEVALGTACFLVLVMFVDDKRANRKKTEVE